MWLPGTCQDKTCFFQTNLLQAHPVLPGEQLPAPPSHRPQPHVATLHGSHHRAHTSHRPVLPPQLLLHHRGPGWDPQALPVAAAPQLPQPYRCAEHRAEPVCAGRARQRGSTGHSTAGHDAELVVSLGPSLLSSSAGPTSAGATKAVASGHGSMWCGHIYTSELQQAEPGRARSCPNHGTLPGQPAQDGMGFAGRQQLDPATFWQHSPGWLPHTAQLPGHGLPRLCQLWGALQGRRGLQPGLPLVTVLPGLAPSHMSFPGPCPAQPPALWGHAQMPTVGFRAEHCTVRGCGMSSTPGTQ